MDPISAVITIAGGIQTVFTFASALKAFVDDAKGAKEDLQNLARTIETTFNAIEELQTLLEENETTHAWNEFGTKRAKGCIQDGFFIISKLSHVLLRTGTKLDQDVAENIDTKIFSVLMWPYYKPQVRELMTELMLLKLDVGTAHTTYRAPNWTAAEAIKGKQVIEQYQTSRKLFVRQLQALKRERRKMAKGLDGDSDHASYSSDNSSYYSYSGSSHSNDSGHASPPAHHRLQKEEERIFAEWEEAVTERVKLEARLKEEEADAAKRQEQKIRNDYVKQIKQEAASRQAELQDKRDELEELIKDKDIPPKDKQQIIDSAIQALHPVMQDSELVLALLNQPQISTQTPRVPIAMPDQTQKQAPTVVSSGKGWLSKRSANSSKADINTLVPPLLRDDAAPGGVAVLYAAHFTPTPYGVYYGLEVDSKALWEKCSAKFTKGSTELTAEFMYLPENCKRAITFMLDELTLMSKDYTWKLFLVYEAQSKTQKGFLRFRKASRRHDPSAGVFVIFKRHLRQIHDISHKSANAARYANDMKANESVASLSGKVPNEQNAQLDSQMPSTTRAGTFGDTSAKAQFIDQTQPTHDVDKETDDEKAVLNIEYAQNDDGAVCYRLTSPNMDILQLLQATQWRWTHESRNSRAFLILADFPEGELHTKLLNAYVSQQKEQGRYESFPRLAIETRFGDFVLEMRARLLQQEKTVDNLSRKLMRDDRTDVSGEDQTSNRDTPLGRSRQKLHVHKRQPNSMNRLSSDVDVMERRESPMRVDTFESAQRRTRENQPVDLPILFHDALGRKFTFPWQTCRTWQGMEGLINQAFLNIDVLEEHVKLRHYDLVGPHHEIILPFVWDTSVEPGMLIKMHLWPMMENEPSPSTRTRLRKKEGPKVISRSPIRHYDLPSPPDKEHRRRDRRYDSDDFEDATWRPHVGSSFDRQDKTDRKISVSARRGPAWDARRFHEETYGRRGDTDTRMQDLRSEEEDRRLENRLKQEKEARLKAELQLQRERLAEAEKRRDLEKQHEAERQSLLKGLHEMTNRTHPNEVWSRKDVRRTSIQRGRRRERSRDAWERETLVARESRPPIILRDKQRRRSSDVATETLSVPIEIIPSTSKKVGFATRVVTPLRPSERIAGPANLPDKEPETDSACFVIDQWTSKPEEQTVTSMQAVSGRDHVRTNGTTRTLSDATEPEVVSPLTTPMSEGKPLAKSEEPLSIPDNKTKGLQSNA